MRAVRRHIIHCSDSPDDRDVDAAEIKRWHLERGWADIGYHFVIRRNGDIEGGRPLAQPGAHCEGHNRDSIGTCLVGRHGFAEGQIRALKYLHMVLGLQFPGLTVHGHRDFNPRKTCPNFEVAEVFK